MLMLNFDGHIVSIPKSQILVNQQGKAKINYVVELEYNEHRFAFEEPLDPMIEKEDIESLGISMPREKHSVLKTYGDFKRLH